MSSWRKRIVRVRAQVDAARRDEVRELGLKRLVGAGRRRAAAARDRRRGRSSRRSGRAARSTPGRTSRASSGSRSAAGTRLPGARSLLAGASPPTADPLRTSSSRNSGMPSLRAMSSRLWASSSDDALRHAVHQLREVGVRQRLEHELRHDVLRPGRDERRPGGHARAACPGRVRRAAPRAARASTRRPSAGPRRAASTGSCAAVERDELGGGLQRDARAACSGSTSVGRRDRSGRDRQRVGEHRQVVARAPASPRRPGGRAAWPAARRVVVGG